MVKTRRHAMNHHSHNHEKNNKARIKPNNNNSSSFSENEMMGLGLFGSSSPASSSSSSNLSPLALPFTLGRSNHNHNHNHKFNSGSNPNPNPNPNSHFNSNSDGVAFWSTSPNFNSSTTNSQGLLADSIRTATVPSTYSTNPNPSPSPSPITTPIAHNRSDVYSSAIGPNPTVIDASFSTFSSPVITQTTHNWSSMNSSVKSGLEPVNQPAAGMNPNPQVIDASFSTFSNPSNGSRTHNWCSMSSGVKSGLDHVNAPAGHLFGMNPSVEPHTWSLGHAGSDDDATMMGLNFNLLQDYGSSQANYSQSLFGSKYSGKADGARGKEDSSILGGVFGIGSHVTGENSIGPSITTCHGLVSGGISNEHTFPRNDSASQYLFDTGSVVYDSLNDMSITSKTLDFSSSIFNKHNLSSSHNSLQEKESYQPVGFDYKSSLNAQVPDIKSAEEVNSAVPLSEHLDHHNPGEDSPCWKGVPTRFSSSGSQEDESAQHPTKKLQKNSGEDVPLHTGPSFKTNVDDTAKAVPAEGLDANMVVKALNNLSELLVLHYSKEGCGLKEQDQKALDHVIANLNACMSRKSQVDVDLTQKCSSPQHIPSNTLHEDRKNDQFDKNIEELQDAYASDEKEHLPKDYNMVQKIKKILDDNIEGKGDVPSDPVLFKNLWLEAEAELCVSSYRARLHRAKRELGREKPLVPGLSGVASDIKKVSISNFSPTSPEPLREVVGSKAANTHGSNLTFFNFSPTAPEPLREAAGSKTVNKHGPDLSFPVGNTDDVENSVMARLNILKSREESCPINVAEKEPADEAFLGKELQSSGVAEEPRILHHHDTDNAAVVPSHDNHKDDDHAIMARWNILKSRYAQVSEVGTGTSMTQNQVGSPTAASFGWEYVDKHG